MVDWLVNKLDGDRSNFVNHYAAEDPFLFKLTGYLDNVSSARFRRDRLRTDIFAVRGGLKPGMRPVQSYGIERMSVR